MRISCYLLIGAGGAVEIRKQRPRHLDMSRVAVHLTIQVDDAWFRRPVPTAEIVIPEAAVLPMPVVQTEIVDEAPDAGLAAENEFLREWLRSELTIADADIDQALTQAQARAVKLSEG